MAFEKISYRDLQMNPMTLIGERWMLITAGSEKDGYNTMTASWGHLGFLWKKPTSTIYIRPQRYTKVFADREPLYTLCFFPDSCKSQLGYLGRNSGRDGDKVAAVGFTPVFADGYTYFEQAELVLVCRKLYQAPILPSGFVDASIVDENYPNRDFHDQYVGEIVEVLVKK